MISEQLGEANASAASATVAHDNSDVKGSGCSLKQEELSEEIEVKYKEKSQNQSQNNSNLALQDQCIPLNSTEEVKIDMTKLDQTKKTSSHYSRESTLSQSPSKEIPGQENERMILNSLHCSY